MMIQKCYNVKIVTLKCDCFLVISCKLLCKNVLFSYYKVKIITLKCVDFML